METYWIALVLVSAATHPLRDLVLKGVAHPVSCYVGVSLTWVIMAAVHTLVMGHDLSLPYEVWPFVAISALGLTIYYYGTLSALRRGNLSVYYPIIRSSPIAIVAFSWLALDQHYSWFTLVGIALVLLGSLMIQKLPGGLLHDHRAFALASMAMLGSAAYSLSDAHAMKLTNPAPFLFFTYTLVTPLLAGIRAWEDRHLSAPFMGVVRGWAQAPVRIEFAGIVSYLSYLFILTAFQLGAETATVSAVRQASIPVSVTLAAIILKESRFLHRIGWASLIALGILLITLSRG
ncbi:EamA family transporter [Ruegeria sp. HKCCSA071]|uniref:EamA family transporter n=1 Tax=Ruegeria sp. HKCCSA071 TaxID=2794834 RepID=UPI001AE71917|nr:EamA family transporter [Ruegeria sp. HKCCSA071]